MVSDVSPCYAQTAEEFLVRVKLEAAELPDVVEATHIDSRVYVSRQTRYMPAQVSQFMLRKIGFSKRRC